MAVLRMIASFFVAVLLPLISLCVLHALSTSGSTVLSFSAKLIHRDSPESPLYDPNSTPFSRSRAVVDRCVRRANYLRNITVNSRLLKNVQGGISGGIITHGYHYLMELHIGNQKVRLMLDTGSNIILVKCVPCEPFHECNGPIIDPKASPTFKNIMCKSNACSSVPHKPCDDSSAKCPLDITYVDGSSAKGFYARETMRFDSPNGKVSVHVPGSIIACVHKSSGFPKGIIGIIGLNGLKSSLPHQLNSIIGIPNKFSYCLSADDGFSEIHFGSAAVASDPRAITIPMFIGNEGFYYIDLNEIIVISHAARPLHFAMKKQEKGPHKRHEGNIIIDSGSPLTFFPKLLMGDIWEEVKNHVPSLPLVEFSGLKCFNISEPFDEKLLPRIILEFTGGAQLQMTQPFHYIFYDLLCFTVIPNDEISILGTFAHQNIRTVYKLDEGELTFIPGAC